jgi:hypothetical protein
MIGPSFEYIGEFKEGEYNGFGKLHEQNGVYEG